MINTPDITSKSAKEKFDLPDESLEDLTGLYEEARFSEHEISAKDSNKAEIYLDSIATNIRKTTLPEDKKPDITSKTVEMIGLLSPVNTPPVSGLDVGRGPV